LSHNKASRVSTSIAYNLFDKLSDPTLLPC
jgi:hypothetical protein